MNPLISLIVPVYNVEKYIGKCLDSLLGQTYPNIEIILINDGSQDSSLEICKQYQKKHSNIKIFSFENKGISRTRNRGLDRASGDYIMFVDSDDFLEKDALEKMMHIMKTTKADIVMCGFVMDYFKIFPLYRRVAKKAVLTPLETVHRMISNQGINNYPWAKLFARHTLEGIRFPENVIGFEDTRTIFKAYLKAERIATMPNRFYHYVQRSGSITNCMSLETVLEMKEAYIFQQKYLQEKFPEENFEYTFNFYNIDMVIIYTLLIFTKRKDHPSFQPTVDQWDKVPAILKFAYVVWLGLACIKFGWKLKNVDWNAGYDTKSYS